MKCEVLVRALQHEHNMSVVIDGLLRGCERMLYAELLSIFRTWGLIGLIAAYDTLGTGLPPITV